MKRTSMLEARASAEILLAERGLKRTSTRVHVLAELMRAHEPLSIDVLTKRVPDVHMVTLYRMLERFVEEGIVYQTDFRNGKAWFEFQPHHHHHITCTGCGRTEDIDICIKKEEENALRASRHFTSVKSHILEFFGRCRTCKTSST